MKDTLNHLFAYRTLPQEEAHRVVLGIAQGQYNPAQIAAFLTVYLMRSVTVEELAGFRNALLELCRPVDLGGIDAMDKGKERHGKKVFGALGIGGLKLKLHRACVGQLFDSTEQVLDAEEIYALAKKMA